MSLKELIKERNELISFRESVSESISEIRNEYNRIINPLIENENYEECIIIRDEFINSKDGKALQEDKKLLKDIIELSIKIEGYN
jgi:hypothetical protein